MDSNVAVDSPNTQHLCPEPFQPHQKHIPDTCPDLSLLAPVTSSPKHCCSLALLTVFYLSFHSWGLQVTDTPLLPWVVAVEMTARFKGWVKEKKKNLSPHTIHYK